jgi:hypothetical protein
MNFEGLVFASPEFDVSNAALAGEIRFLKHGIYSIEFCVQAGLNPPFPAPVPSWAVALFVDGVRLAATSIGGFSQSPDDDTENSAGQILVEIQAGSVLKMRNIIVGQGLLCKAVHPELAFPITVGNIKIFLLKDLT